MLYRLREVKRGCRCIRLVSRSATLCRCVKSPPPARRRCSKGRLIKTVYRFKLRCRKRLCRCGLVKKSVSRLIRKLRSRKLVGLVRVRFEPLTTLTDFHHGITSCFLRESETKMYLQH